MDLLKAIAVFIWLTLTYSVVAEASDIVCVWPDGTQTMPDYYTNTCPAGSTPMRARR